jgi:type IV pilus assembly protein PilO
MTLADLNKYLDPKNVGSAPAVVKAGIIAVLCVLVFAAGYWFDTQHQIADLEKVRKEEAQKFASFEAKQAKAANLEPLKQQLEQIKKEFGEMLRQLPNQAEIEALLVDISQTGLATGLEFELFQPLAEVPREFYAEKPIKLVVTGSYHKFGEFVSGVAALPRIVTQHDITIKPRGKDSDLLVMEATAKTYRYLDESSQAQAPKEAGKGKGAKGGAKKGAKTGTEKK